jgi:hypothetical protein
MDRISGRFTRHEPRRHAAELMLGLLSDLDRKNCWSIAEHRGAKTPDALQHLLSRAVWDAYLIRDDLRGYVIDNLGDPGAVLVVDETGDLKKGTHSVGVQRQYTGTAGRIENSQVAVYLAYAAPTGHALIDRALYLPQSWTERPDRCADAGIPAGTEFATKPALATAMITAALDAGAPASWVAGDEVYGADPTLRATLEGRGVGYVLAVASNRRVPTTNGPLQVDFLAAALPARSWQRLSAGAGSRGQRMYSWAWIPINPAPTVTTGCCCAATTPPASRLLSGVLAQAGATRCAGQGRRPTLAGRGMLPDREGTHRPGPAPGPAMEILASVGHSGDARARVPDRNDRRRTRRQTDPAGADPDHRERAPQTLRRPATATEPQPGTTPPMVDLASTTPSQSPRQPLPTTRRITMITN